VVLGVEDVVGDALLLQDAGDRGALLHARRADQDRAAPLVLLEDLADHGGEFLPLRLEDHVLVVLADHGLVGRDRGHVQLVGGHELLRFGLRRPRHAGELLVEPEEVLEGDGGHRAALLLDPHVLLGLHRLVQPVAPRRPGRTRPVNSSMMRTLPSGVTM
jgi:hypothetical protein